MPRRHPSPMFGQEVLDACTEARGQWVDTGDLHQRLCSPGAHYRGPDSLDDAIQRLADKGQIVKRDRYNRSALIRLADPVDPAPEPEAPTARTQQIANLLSRHPVTDAEAEFIRKLLPPAHE